MKDKDRSGKEKYSSAAQREFSMAKEKYFKNKPEPKDKD